MSWNNELFKIYEKFYGKAEGMLPVSHTTASSQLEVTLSENGEFLSARIIENKKDVTIVIPVTEDSASRTGDNSPHALFDKLLYIAGDYSKYTDVKRSDNKEYYEAYMKQLQDWKNSIYSHPAVHAIYEYLNKGCLIEDLIKSGCLSLDEKTGKLDPKKKVLGISQVDVLIRFKIKYQDKKMEECAWKDKTLQDNFCSYYLNSLEGKQLCYGSGEVVPVSYKHPAKLRSSSDRAKLISANDDTGFTFKGRFNNKEEANSVGYEYTQKVHNALKWLIERQGIFIESMVILIWDEDLSIDPDVIKNFDKSEKYKMLKDTILGERKFDDLDEITKNKKVMLAVLDAATKGRMSMSMYEEIRLSEFFASLERWHRDTAWPKFNTELKKCELSAQSLYDIAKYAYGTEQGDFIACEPSQECNIISRLLPCVVKGMDIPSDIVMNIVRKASRPTAYQKDYNKRKVLETACGLVRKKIIEEKGECKMTLDLNCKDRSYLFGRLLAIAEEAESVTYVDEEKRVTNAGRIFEMFSNRPSTTWMQLHNRLMPYLNKMDRKKRGYYMEVIGEVTGMFENGDYTDNSKLKPLFLQGYYHQLYYNDPKKEKLNT